MENSIKISGLTSPVSRSKAFIHAVLQIKENHPFSGKGDAGFYAVGAVEAVPLSTQPVNKRPEKRGVQPAFLRPLRPSIKFRGLIRSAGYRATAQARR